MIVLHDVSCKGNFRHSFSKRQANQEYRAYLKLKRSFNVRITSNIPGSLDAVSEELCAPKFALRKWLPTPGVHCEAKMSTSPSDSQ